MPLLPKTKSAEYLGASWADEVNREEGSSCPTCGRFLKIYHRKISSSMAAGLMRLFGLTIRHQDRRYFHIREFYRDRGDFAKLKFWGFIEEEPNKDPTKRTSGYWRLTDWGIKFILLENMVPQYVMLKWNSELIGFAGPAVDLQTCLEFKNKFNYAELMSSALNQV